MKPLPILALLACTFFAPHAQAGQCQTDIAAIDAALAKTDIDADVRAQGEDMRNQAIQLCGAGNETEGLAVTAEVKELLKLE